MVVNISLPLWVSQRPQFKLTKLWRQLFRVQHSSGAKQLAFLKPCLYLEELSPLLHMDLHYRHTVLKHCSLSTARQASRLFLPPP